MCANCEIVKEELVGNLRSYESSGEFSNTPGVYAFSLKRGHELQGIIMKKSRLLYVGKTENGRRNHFRYERSASSTLRRSLGALKGYTVGGATENSPNNYWFIAEHEAELSKWMKDSLNYSFVEIAEGKEGIRKMEIELIECLNPPLNLTHSNNQSVEFVKEARLGCRDKVRKKQESNEKTK
jgi:hypothetical protein